MFFRLPEVKALNVDAFVCTCAIVLALDHQLRAAVASCRLRGKRVSGLNIGAFVFNTSW